MKKIPMAKLTGDYVGKPFHKCGCMPLVYGMYTDLEIEFPTEFEDLTLENYLSKWQADKKTVIEQMVRLFESIGKPVDIDKLKKFDLLAVEENGNKYAAIYLGDNKAITSNINVGVRVFFLGDIHKVVLARRLI